MKKTAKSLKKQQTVINIASSLLGDPANPRSSFGWFNINHLACYTLRFIKFSNFWMRPFIWSLTTPQRLQGSAWLICWGQAQLRELLKRG